MIGKKCSKNNILTNSKLKKKNFAKIGFMTARKMPMDNTCPYIARCNLS